MMETLNYDFWKYFKEISNIPRRSGEESKIAKYIIDFAIKRNFKYYTDKYNNVVIWKEASEGLQDKEILGLQCHTDMICEKLINTEHDFSKDPLKLIVEGDFIKAVNTTLGADDGIGVAYILAILDSKEIKHPKLECIFTTEEETTMNGAMGLDASILQSKRIISFDNDNEEEMWISSATAKEWTSTIKEPQIDLNPEEFTTFCLNLDKFKGGHSGIDIGDVTRGNPIKIIAELLNCFSDVYISDFEGGSKVNIIPRDCKIIFSINNNELSKVSVLENEISRIKNMYQTADISLNKINNVQKSYSKQLSENLLKFINSFQNGAIVKDEYGNVILSGNFGAVKKENEVMNLLYSIRYNSSKLGLKLENKIESDMEHYNIEAKNHGNILGYEQEENSQLIECCEKIYYKCFNKKIKKVKVQACLECGYFSNKIPNLQYVAIAPNIYNAHSPDERMSIKSANKMWNFIIEILENIN